MSRSTAMAPLRVVAVALLTLFVPAISLLLASSPAHADGASLTVTPPTDLDPAGSNLTVTGKGYEPSTGLFIVVCDPTVPKGGACDMANFQQAQTDAAGAFQVTLKAVAVFGQTDCSKIPCGVQTSKVGEGANRTQERTVPIGFTGGVAPADGWPGVGSADSDPGDSGDDSTDSSGDKSKDDAKESKSSTPIVIGGVVVLAVIGAAVFVLARRRRQAADIQ